ncbi:putative zinc-binding oxidoreductase ToxD [Aspergillus steynii IBT 23096]|uniref:Putative zinc-binding oxidoreductase ToxD n=1 Tax=Aspergillus steynii IBT 23096 TaxID=1392250 RepID=A0A2I2GPC2_9EURO|nr:putative zinc-binding oxidoreductase ToxD [Aspergillus steynii IBT 23096]PLB54713.1 putative zinc-binding oxidoreductase ToxD [Aspergillus steynii IBT 23096]
MPQKALVVSDDHQPVLVADHPIPKLRDNFILVKTVSVALNPTDWKQLENNPPAGAVIGCDYAGIVEEVGKGVTKPFRKGDRICGFAHGSNLVQPENGAFAEYIVVKGDAAALIPDSLSFEEAATLGIGIATVGQSLYQDKGLGLALPSKPLAQPEPILIYGGSSASGSLAIQFAKLSGYTVITTCSPRNFDFVKQLGADLVFDYRDPEAPKAIREYTKDGLKLVFDTIGLDDAIKFCDSAFSPEGGDYVTLLLSKLERENVKSRWILAYATLGEYFKYGPYEFPEVPEDFKFAAWFWDIAQPLLAEGKIKPHTPKVCAGGLNGVIEGLKLMKEGKVSGEKLVYNIADTP